ncbi:MAG: HEAT repeat domain-containing protein [Vicinamibacterales bacterium]|nr:HEAT repeat domain-containing protein [Vicinamibacterales bacterium]
MTWVTHIAGSVLAAIVLAAPAGAAQLADAIDRAEEQVARAEAPAEREAARQAREADRAQGAADRAQRDYERAQRALEDARFSEAAEAFRAIVAAQGARADAALYWQAYALDRQGRQAEALAAVAELVKGYPNSRWLGDAKALEIQVRQNAGQPVRPEQQADEELKLLAIQALQHQDPAQAVPMLRQFLQGPQSIKLKERALFVLAQSRSPEARTALTEVARGASNPDLQRRAIDYLGVHGSGENRALLAEIYAASNDVDVKRRILRAYMIAGDRARVLAAATGEADPALRAEGVQQLGVMGAHDELWQLYQKETSADVKRRIQQAMFIGGDATRLLELARAEADVDLRRNAVRQLGIMSAEKTGTALLEIYARETDQGIKRAVIQALFIQNNAESLVALARRETDPAMKKAMVQQLSLMKSKVALDYLMEMLGK